MLGDLNGQKETLDGGQGESGLSDCFLVVSSLHRRLTSEMFISVSDSAAGVASNLALVGLY